MTLNDNSFVTKAYVDKRICRADAWLRITKVDETNGSPASTRATYDYVNNSSAIVDAKIIIVLGDTDEYEAKTISLTPNSSGSGSVEYRHIGWSEGDVTGFLVDVANGSFRYFYAVEEELPFKTIGDGLQVSSSGVLSANSMEPISAYVRINEIGPNLMNWTIFTGYSLGEYDVEIHVSMCQRKDGENLEEIYQEDIIVNSANNAELSYTMMNPASYDPTKEMIVFFDFVEPQVRLSAYVAPTKIVVPKVYIDETDGHLKVEYPSGDYYFPDGSSPE